MKGDDYYLSGFPVGKLSLFTFAFSGISGLFVGLVVFLVMLISIELFVEESSTLLSKGAFMLGLYSGLGIFTLFFFVIFSLGIIYNVLARYNFGVRLNLFDESMHEVNYDSI